MALDIDQFNEYLMATTTIGVDEFMDELTSHDWPNLKQDSRNKIISGLKSKAGIFTVEAKKQELSNKDVMKIIMGK